MERKKQALKRLAQLELDFVRICDELIKERKPHAGMLDQLRDAHISLTFRGLREYILDSKED